MNCPTEVGSLQLAGDRLASRRVRQHDRLPRPKRDVPSGVLVGISGMAARGTEKCCLVRSVGFVDTAALGAGSAGVPRINSRVKSNETIRWAALPLLAGATGLPCRDVL